MNSGRINLLVTLLTGKRPGLLERTLSSIQENQPELLSFPWLVLHNGGDPETREVLDLLLPEQRLLQTTSDWLDIGDACSQLFHLSGLLEGPEYVLHLEDDWEASPGSFLAEGVELLSRVFQVRLRLATEPVRSLHMVTGAPIRWTPAEGAQISPDAHYTLNPSLLRAEDLRYGWPARSENAAQRNFWKANRRRVAQLLPGIWSHSGGSDSLNRLYRKGGVGGRLGRRSSRSA